MQAYRDWSETGINLKGRISGSIKTVCPNCERQGTRSNPKDPSLSVNIDKQVWNCHYCNWKGGLTHSSFEMKKQYAKPAEDINKQPISEKLTEWFGKRGITRETMDKFMVYPSIKFIQKAEKKVPVICFPYFKKGEIANVKSRYDYIEGDKRKKTFSLEKDCEQLFYNIDAVDGFTHCVIVEGEIDAMAVWQATGQPVISVPNGSPLKDNQRPEDLKMEYLENCAEYFADKTLICLALDGDGPGIHLRDELARRLGKNRCYYVEYPEGCKDMNEVLMMYGAEFMEEMFQNLHAFPIEGVVTLTGVEDELDDYYENGYPTGETIGHPSFDKLLTFRGGEVTTITGIPSHGKSEFVDEILVQLAKKGWKHGLFAAENGSSALHFTRLAHRYAEAPFQNTRYGLKMTRDQYTEAKTFLNAHFFFVNNRHIRTVTGILEKAQDMVLRFGIKGFVIDPWNCMETERPRALSETEYVGMIYDRLVDFAVLYDVHIFLVAHPTKLQKNKQDNKYEVPTMYNISGSANFYNKTYNGITIYRDFEANTTTAYVQKVKFDFIGQVGYVEFTYNPLTRRYKELLPTPEAPPEEAPFPTSIENKAPWE